MLTKTTEETKRTRSAPHFSSTEVEKWNLLLRAYLKRDDAEWVLMEDEPVTDVAKANRLLGPNGEQTKRWKAFWNKEKTRHDHWSKKNGIAYSAIVEGCEGHNGAMLVVMERAGDDSAKGLYEALLKKFRIQHTALLQMELARFNSMKMAPNETGSDYVNRILEAKVKLVQYGYRDLQDNIHLLERLKTGLKSNMKYAQLATTLQCMPAVTWDMAVEQLTVHERLRQEEDETTKTEKANLITTKSQASHRGHRDKRCRRCKKVGHIAAQCRTNLGNRRSDVGGNQGGSNLKFGRRYDPDSKVKLECYVCGGPHKAFECPHKHGAAAKRVKTEPEEASQRKFEGRVYMMQEKATLATGSCRHKHLMALDSGATVHIVNAHSLNADTEVEYAPTVIRTAHAGDTMHATARADLGVMQRVCIMEDNTLDMNLASVACFDKAGYRIVFEGGTGVVYDSEGNTIVEAQLIDDLYIFDLRDTMAHERALLASSAPKEDLNLWHRRLGHRNKRDILAAVNKDLILEISKTAVARNSKPEPICDSCAKSRCSRVAFHRDGRKSTALNVLKPISMEIKRISTDIKGPLGIAGPKREVYYQSFIDNSTKWIYAYFMEYRSQALDNARHLVEKQLPVEYGVPHVVVRQYLSDGAPELISSDILALMHGRGTQVCWSPPYTPEMNAVVERSHQTIFNMGYAMLLEAVVPMQYWTYAIKHAVYIFNRFPTTTEFGYMSPYQAKYGTPPELDRIKTWGCICYAHIPAELRDKGFVDKAYKGYYLGVHEPTGSAVVYYIELDTVGKSMHVVYDEVTALRRDTTQTLEVQEERRVVGDFEYLIGMCYRDDENGLLYVTQRLTTQRGYIVAWVARVSVDGVVGPTEDRPVHVPEVAKMVMEYQRSETPWVLSANEWHKIGDGSNVELSGASRESAASTGDGQVTTSGQGSGSQSKAINPAQEVSPVSSSGADHLTTTEPRHRFRKRRVPLNVGVMGDTRGTTQSAKMLRSDSNGMNKNYLLTSTVVNTSSTAQEESLEDYYAESRCEEITTQLLARRCWTIGDVEYGAPVIPSRWVDCLKDPKDESTKKSRLVARGDRDKSDHDFSEIYAPVAHMTTLRVYLSLVAILRMETIQLDVKTAFLYADIAERIYVEPPRDLRRILLTMLKRTVGVERSLVHRELTNLENGGKLLLHKSLYGLKQSPKNWHTTIDAFMKRIGLRATKSDPCLYYLVEGGELLLLLLYVDDICTYRCNYSGITGSLLSIY